MKTSSLHKIWHSADLKVKIDELKNDGKTLVFTNGVFDILHAGHVHYLQETAALADFLIVGINSDSSVQRLDKSPARPLQNETSRAQVLSALHCVDAVVVFEEDTPKNLIETITPHILVKGGDYQISQIVGADWVKNHGGTVTTISFLQGYSTSSIEQKIIQSFKNQE
jgi:D-beta-D-heptose 7-phosphate kinase/D-beta-D-heptose 1-phosphate adenosyltransferase